MKILIALDESSVPNRAAREAVRLFARTETQFLVINVASAPRTLGRRSRLRRRRAARSGSAGDRSRRRSLSPPIWRPQAGAVLWPQRSSSCGASASSPNPHRS